MKFTEICAAITLLASSTIAVPVNSKRQAAITDVDILQYALTVSAMHMKASLIQFSVKSYSKHLLTLSFSAGTS